MSYLYFRKLVNIIFPARCIFCRRTIQPENDLLVCKRCQNIFAGIGEQSFSLPAGLGQCRYAFKYKNEVRSAILRFKFGGKPQYAKSFSYFLLPLIRKYTDYDFISWAPISPLRYLRRTYDQSKLLASALSRISGIPLRRTLRKRRHTRAQSTLSSDERHLNVQGVYAPVNRKSICGAKILLVDDVVTTGATLAECTRTLYKEGAADVAFIALAHGNKK